MKAKVPGGDLATDEKARTAERQIAIVRLFVVVLNSFVYLALMGGVRTAPGLAHLVIAVALTYTTWVLWLEPYRRYPRLFSSTFSSVTDVVLILVWLQATGGTASPFYLLIYLSVTAVAFRYGYRQTALAALIYSGAYLALLLALGGTVGVADVVVRVAYVAPFALLAALMSRELSRHMQSRVALAERLRLETELAERRSRFLAGASALLTSSLEWDELPARVARLVVPSLGDNCVLDLVDEDGTIQRMAEASVDPAQEALLRRLRDFPVAAAHDRSPVRKAIDTNEVVVISKFDEAALTALQREDEYAALIRRIGPTSSVTIPLRSRGRALGAMTFGMAASGRSHSADDIALATELAQRAALAIDNAYLYRQARQAIDARDAFLSIASHELRNPLATLSLQARRLSRLTVARDPGGATLDAVARGSDKIAEQTRRLDRMIGQLLDVSRIATDHLDLDLQDVDLMAVVTEVVDCFDEECARTGSPISVMADEQPVTGRWDRLRLDQIVTNLVGNAVKYGAGRPIQVEVARASDRARVIVQDQGIGIAHDQQPRLFQRFERLVGRDSPRGLGLGLWITRRLVEAMGGSIVVESELGRGARFVVELPRSAESEGVGDLN